MEVAFPGQSLKTEIGVPDASRAQFLSHPVFVESFHFLTDRHSASGMAKKKRSIHESSEQDVYRAIATHCNQSASHQQWDNQGCRLPEICLQAEDRGARGL
jgi:hypothetical protein